MPLFFLLHIFDSFSQGFAEMRFPVSVIGSSSFWMPQVAVFVNFVKIYKIVLILFALNGQSILNEIDSGFNGDYKTGAQEACPNEVILSRIGCF